MPCSLQWSQCLERCRFAKGLEMLRAAKRAEQTLERCRSRTWLGVLTSTPWGTPGKVQQPPWGWTAAALLPAIPEPRVWWVRLGLSGLASRRALAAGAAHAGHGCARGCKALYAATGAGFVSEERKGKQRAAFPIMNKAAVPSILMRQGGKNQRLGSQYTMGYNRDLAFFFKRRAERDTDRREQAAKIGTRTQACTCAPLVEGVLCTATTAVGKVPRVPWSSAGRGEAASLPSGRGAAPSLARAFDPWVHVAQCGPVAQDLSPNAGLLLMR